MVAIKQPLMIIKEKADICLMKNGT